VELEKATFKEIFTRPELLVARGETEPSQFQTGRPSPTKFKGRRRDEVQKKRIACGKKRTIKGSEKSFNNANNGHLETQPLGSGKNQSRWKSLSTTVGGFGVGREKEDEVPVEQKSPSLRRKPRLGIGKGATDQNILIH